MQLPKLTLGNCQVDCISIFLLRYSYPGMSFKNVYVRVLVVYMCVCVRTCACVCVRVYTCAQMAVSMASITILASSLNTMVYLFFVQMTFSLWQVSIALSISLDLTLHTIVEFCLSI